MTRGTHVGCCVHQDSATTPLHWAASNGHVNCVDLLLNHGVAIDVLELVCAACYHVVKVVVVWTDSHFAMVPRRTDSHPCILLLSRAITVAASHYLSWVLVRT